MLYQSILKIKGQTCSIQNIWVNVDYLKCTSAQVLNFLETLFSSHFRTCPPQNIFRNRHHCTRHKRLAHDKRSFVACLVRIAGWNIHDSSSKLKIIVETIWGLHCRGWVAPPIGQLQFREQNLFIRKCSGNLLQKGLQHSVPGQKITPAKCMLEIIYLNLSQK